MSDPETHRILGQLQGTMASVQRQLATSEEKATESRSRMHRQLEDIRTDARDSKTRLEAVERQLKDDIKPVIRTVLDWRAQWIGAMCVMGVIGSAVVFLLTQAKDALADAWKAFIGR